MTGFLLVVPPLAGHIAPLRTVAATLEARGHRVVWAGAAGWLRPRLSADATIEDCVPAGFADPMPRPAELRGLRAFRCLIEDYLAPLAGAMLPALRAAIERHRPDVVVADQQTWAGAYAADLAGVPWATSATTTAELCAPTPAGWWDPHFRAVRSGSSLSDPRFSDRLILAFSTPELAGPAVAAPRSVRWVGPALSSPRETNRSPRPLVLVTLGTVNAAAGARFLRASAEALTARPDLDALIVDPAGDLGPQPPSIRVARRIPQTSVLPRASLVVCHAGHNTVTEALWHGLPLVVAPIRDDQPVIAAQVVAAGAGIRLRFAHAGAVHIGAAVDEILAGPRYPAAAARIARSFHSAGGAEAATAHLEALVGVPA